MATALHILGPCVVKWDGKDIGHSRDGFSVRFNMNRRAVNVDNLGDTPAALLYKGATAEISGQLVKFDEEAIHNLNKLCGFADIGTGMMAKAKAVTIVGSNGTYTFYKALPSPNIELGPLGTNETVCPITFIAYPYTDGRLYDKT